MFIDVVFRQAVNKPKNKHHTQQVWRRYLEIWYPYSDLPSGIPV
jgi:hypothetical protein